MRAHLDRRDYDFVERAMIRAGRRSHAKQRWDARKSQNPVAYRTLTRGQRRLIIATIWLAVVTLAVFVAMAAA
jgi:hypothetical protein